MEVKEIEEVDGPVELMIRAGLSAREAVARGGEIGRVSGATYGPRKRGGAGAGACGRPADDEVEGNVVGVESARKSKDDEVAVAEFSVVKNDCVVLGRTSTAGDAAVGWTSFDPNNPLDDLFMRPVINPSTLSPADSRRDGVEDVSSSRSGDCPATSGAGGEVVDVERLRESERRRSDIDVDIVDLDAEADDGAISGICSGRIGSTLALGCASEAGSGASVAPRRLSSIEGDGGWLAQCSDDKDPLREDDGRDELNRGAVLLCCTDQFFPFV